MKTCTTILLLLLLVSGPLAVATPAAELQPGVRGLATRAPEPMKIDGNLEEFAGAFCTPVNYFHPEQPNRAAQFFYMWDDEAFYAGLRTLDAKQANHAPDDRLWEGDGVEWYFDTRRNDDFRGRNWGPGAVHMYWVAYNKAELKPRWCLRPDMLDAIRGEGVEVAARRTAYGAEIEFKLPWKNFPEFRPKLGEVIALDAELCYSDGGPRVDRTFAYGSPLSVQQPASQARVQLVERLEPEHWRQCGPVMMPIRCDTAWNQETRPMVTAQLALPPNHADRIGKVVFRVVGTDGVIRGEFTGQPRTFNAEGKFQLCEAAWSSELAEPGTFFVLALVFDAGGNELTRIAPRLVSVGMAQGY